MIYNLYQITGDINLAHSGNFTTLENAQNAAGVKPEEWIEREKGVWEFGRWVIRKTPLDQFVLA